MFNSINRKGCDKRFYSINRTNVIKDLNETFLETLKFKWNVLKVKRLK